MAKETGKYYEGIGRRKLARARVRFYPESPGGFVVNEKEYKEYFPVLRFQQSATAPLRVLDSGAKKGSKVTVSVRGGGVSAQADAVTLGLARALVKYNEEFKKELRTMGHLTRDARAVERKKFGLKKARRAPQWRKR